MCVCGLHHGQVQGAASDGSQRWSGHSLFRQLSGESPSGVLERPYQLFKGLRFGLPDRISTA